MITSTVKRFRNAAASAVATAVFRAPALERPFAHAASVCRGVPVLHTVFREATDRLGRRLNQTSRQFRTVRIGPVAARFDVTDLAIRGQYFARLPYERGATELLLRVLQPGHVFVDVGANAGYFTVLAALRVGDNGRVYAFEPNPAMCSRLRRHVEENAVASRVVVSEVALGALDESVDLYLSCRSDNPGLSSVKLIEAAVARGDMRPDAKIPVAARTLDTWLADAVPLRIDLIKIDVEGAEMDVLAGMEQTIGRLRPRRIICETLPEGEADAFLRARGYARTVLDEIPGGIPNLLFERTSPSEGTAA
ncbi:MAG TPA: FkbM family methyltransferase [Vicinamibacterales bacterium]|nr:FkbM family methyltransferase [Vicinamibacterales bacterium]